MMLRVTVAPTYSTLMKKGVAQQPIIIIIIIIIATRF